MLYGPEVILTFEGQSVLFYWAISLRLTAEIIVALQYTGTTHMSPEVTFSFIRMPLGLYYTDIIEHTYFWYNMFFTTGYIGNFDVFP